MSNAVAGHGALLGVEQAPVASQGVFTTVAEILDIKPPGMSRPETDVTPHNDGVDSYVLGVITRSALTLTLNFIFNNPTHDHLTGFQSAMKTNEKRGYRFRGPGGAAASHELIMSGQVQNFERTYPARSGQITADVTLRMSGPWWQDGILFS